MPDDWSFDFLQILDGRLSGTPDNACAVANTYARPPHTCTYAHTCATGTHLRAQHRYKFVRAFERGCVQRESQSVRWEDDMEPETFSHQRA